MTKWFAKHPRIETFRVAMADLNGQPRGKRLPVSRADKVLSAGLRMPLSALNLDISGADIEGSPLVFPSGDGDGVVRATGRGPVLMPWLKAPSALVPLWMFHDDGRPFAGDPRHALAAVLARYAQYGWSPLVATELEFYLNDPDTPQDDASEILSLQTLDAYDAFFTDLYRASAEMEIGADAAISEGGAGQFEVNLEHTDAMRAADDTWLFKMLVKGLARQHGLSALFGAKPRAGDAGNGLHVHFSVMTEDEQNTFSDLRPAGRETLHAALAGCLAAMPGSMAILAPHVPSYDRFATGSHAPTGIAWGYENRTTAIRIPGGPAFARRIEHRVAGGDANPYLLIAVILGAALNGIEDELTAPAPLTGDAYSADIARLPSDPDAALKLFESAPEMRRILPPDLVKNFAMTKKQDHSLLRALPEARRRRLVSALI